MSQNILLFPLSMMAYLLFLSLLPLWLYFFSTVFFSQLVPLFTYLFAGVQYVVPFSLNIWWTSVSTDLTSSACPSTAQVFWTLDKYLPQLREHSNPSIPQAYKIPCSKSHLAQRILFQCTSPHLPKSPIL